MRAAPAFRIDIPAQGGWRWAIRTLVLAAASVVMVWWLLPDPDLPAGLRHGFAAAGLLALLSAWRVSSTAPCRLRWDGVDWWFGLLPCADEQMRAGRLTVAVDLQVLLLLRFKFGGPGGERMGWLPVHRSGLGDQWHALRCAVYSARPQPGDMSSGSLPHTSSPRPEPHE